MVLRVLNFIVSLFGVAIAFCFVFWGIGAIALKEVINTFFKTKGD